MRRTRIAALAAAGAIAATGTGVAVATTLSDDAKEREQAVLDDAADRLDVDASELRDALRAAQDEQLDADVKAGRITQEQADAIKEMRERSGLVLGGPGPGIHHFREPGFHIGGPLPLLDAAAKALGLERDELVQRMRDGDSLKEIAAAQGKDYDDAKAAIRDALEKGLDEAVENGSLPREAADEMLEHLTEDLEDGRFGPPRRAHPFFERDGARLGPPSPPANPA